MRNFIIREQTRRSVGCGWEIDGTSWDLVPDDKRGALVAPAESAEGPTREHKVVFLMNSFDELRRKVPAGIALAEKRA